MKRVLDDVAVFCAVVEGGSFKAASQALGIPHSTVSRRVEALESSLGLRLLHRTTRDVQVTGRGQALYNNCIDSINNMKHSIVNAVEDEVEFRGKLNVSLPVRAGIDFLGNWLIDFAAQHSELTLDIALSNSNKNLVRDDIDLAFRVGPLVDASAIANHLWDIPNSLYCHASFCKKYGIKNARISAENMAMLPCVISRPTHAWRFLDKQKQEQQISPNVALFVDDLGLARHAMSSGNYLAMLPTSMIDSYEDNDDIISIQVDDMVPLTRKMYAYYLGKRHAQSQIKHLIAYIKERYKKDGPFAGLSALPL